MVKPIKVNMAILSRSKKYIIVIAACFMLLYSLTYALKPVNKGIKGVKVIKPKPKTLIKASWGKAKGEFGKTNEGSIPGPMSFSIYKNNAYFLDQENTRVQIFSLQGKFIKSFTLRKASYVDIKADNYYVYLLDAYTGFSVDVYSMQGKLVKTFPIDRKLEPITGFQVIDGKILVESNHTNSTLIGTVRGVFLSNVRAIKRFSGRLAKNNNPIKAVFRRSAQVTQNNKRLKFESPDLQAIVDMIVDQNSTYVLLGLSKTNGNASDDYLSLLKITNGHTEWQMLLPEIYSTDHFKKIDVYKGAVYQMQTTRKGLELVRWK